MNTVHTNVTATMPITSTEQRVEGGRQVLEAGDGDHGVRPVARCSTTHRRIELMDPCNASPPGRHYRRHGYRPPERRP